ncbi:unnamed protein product [Timema podura]|uniref:Uncharacterized protein n=1 Tax=Timema podura TaxID=61482 RepID=A0ABN7PNI4_TIMPD|nr:unnamed protein product [Timema podura]
MVGPPMNRSPEEPVCLVRRGNMWTEIREDYILRIYRNLFRKRNKPGPIEELDRAPNEAPRYFRASGSLGELESFSTCSPK